jgi:tetratricopeptide (TPR) repeat protein
MTRAITLFVAVLCLSENCHELHAADPARIDGDLSRLQHLRCNDNDQERHFQDALESTSPLTFKRAKILVLYAQCLLHADDRAAGAVPLLHEALQILPSNASVHRDLGSAYFRLGINQASIDAYERSIELVPDADTYSQLGLAYMRSVSDSMPHHSPEFKERIARSEDNFRHALDLNSSNPAFHGQLGLCLLFQGRREEGLNEIHRAIDLIPNVEDA